MIKQININKKIKKILPFLILFILVVPILVSAYNPLTDSIIPSCGSNCGYDDLMQLVSNIIDWIIMISIPVAAGVIAWAGFKYMTTGVVEQKSEAKGILVKVSIGLVFILAAWLIVSTITKALLKTSPL